LTYQNKRKGTCEKESSAEVPGSQKMRKHRRELHKEETGKKKCQKRESKPGIRYN